MGRFRNLSQSLKAAAFSNSNGHASPSTVDSERSRPPPSGYIATKEVPAVAREASSSSVAVADTPPSTRNGRSQSRLAAHVYNPPTISAGDENQIDELRPVFSFLSSHQNKLYQEGYFLKLNDLDIHGKPNSDRNWTECFAQLVGTVLSLWDAAALDAAGQDGEVAPTFINLADASIKMIETLPTRNKSVQPLQNVLSVSTAGKNRYLLHFNSLHSLTQWTAGIRLAMFEHASLQELYTGSLIAGKGKTLNNIKAIMEKLKFVEEDWARVRFGAGTPWRRCWYVIEPPDEKEWQKAQKSARKRGTYEKPEFPKGDVKFYEKKGKKATLIATISNVYSAYAVYPQSKPLIDQSTLVKLEGRITIHSKPESVTEGFVFVMPEVHPAVSGFEMMLRYLFPVYDTFSLYGRPTRLIADTLDARGLMFAMPQDRRYGYLDIIDVAGLIHTDGSDKWSEREWRKRMKELVSRRMTMTTQGRTSNVEQGGRRSLGARPGVRYEDNASIRSANSQVNQSTDMIFETPKNMHAGPPASHSLPSHINHSRSVSESVATHLPAKQRRYVPSRLSTEQEYRENFDSVNVNPSNMPPSHQHPYKHGMASENEVITSSNSSDSDFQRVGADDVTHDMLPEPTPPAPVAQPTFQHQASDRPQKRPVVRPELRREKSRMSNSTLDQLVDASKNGVGSIDAGGAAAAAWRSNGGSYESQARGVNNKNPIDREHDANPLEKAINTDYPFPPVARGGPKIKDRVPIMRSTSDQTISRKPLPNYNLALPSAQIPPILGNDSEFSIDYESIKRSAEEPDRRKPGGVRKTIGDPNHDQNRQSDVPDFDFGITQSLTPGHSRPGTAAGRLSPLSPLESKTPPTPQTPPNERKSPAGRVSPLPTPPSKPSGHAWLPGSVAGRQSPGGLTAEEFVQQRANMARLPGGYVQRRTVSSSKAEEILSQPTEQNRPRKLQKNPNSRPSSRGSLLDATSSSALSARDQEHVSRMTGSPLLNLPERSQTPDANSGLVGTISAREQDRRIMREGISTQLAQASVVPRQHSRGQSAYSHQVQAQYRPGMNAWSQQQQQQQQQQRHQRQMSQGYYAQQYPQQYLSQHQYPQHYPSQQPYSPQQFYQQSGYQQLPNPSQTQYQPGQQYQEYYAPQDGYRRQ